MKTESERKIELYRSNLTLFPIFPFDPPENQSFWFQEILLPNRVEGFKTQSLSEKLNFHET